MNEQEKPDVDALSTPEGCDRTKADEMAAPGRDETEALQRDLNDDEVVRIAAEEAGTNETHTKTPV